MAEDIYELIERQKEQLRNLDKIETCNHSLFPTGRLWCGERQRTLTRSYCETCDKYRNKELSIGI